MQPIVDPVGDREQHEIVGNHQTKPPDHRVEPGRLRSMESVVAEVGLVNDRRQLDERRIFQAVLRQGSFDAILRRYQLTDPVLQDVATIVRGADTDRLDLAPEAAGLLAISLGLSRNFADDHEQLAHGMVVYDALYAWARDGRDERHTWNPQRVAAR